MIYFLIVIALLIFGLYFYFKFFKIPKLKNIIFIDGSLGTGKSFYSVCLAIRLYKRNLRRFKLKLFLFKYFLRFGKFKDYYLTLEKPLLYSNIRLRNIEFVIVTKDLLSCKK